jgi:hypothetical protein
MPITIKPQEKPEGKYILPKEERFSQTQNAYDILKIMNGKRYEELVASWAYWCLKENDGRKYEDVKTQRRSVGNGGYTTVNWREQDEAMLRCITGNWTRR